MSDKFLVSKADFETFLELIEARVYSTPSYRGPRACKYSASFKLANNVRVDLELNTFDVRPAGNGLPETHYYGRHDAWTHVQLDRWIWNNVSLHGQGSRSTETHILVCQALMLLGQFEEYGMPKEVRS